MNNAIRIYSALLRLYPRGYRQAFGPQMLQTFADQVHDLEGASGAGDSGALSPAFWAATLADELQNIVRQHAAPLSQTGHVLKLTGAKLALSAVLLLPLYLTLCLVLVNVSVAIPHPPLSGLSVIFAFGMLLVVIPGLLSAALSYLLASAFAHTLAILRGIYFPSRKVKSS